MVSKQKAARPPQMLPALFLGVLGGCRLVAFPCFFCSFGTPGGVALLDVGMEMGGHLYRVDADLQFAPAGNQADQFMPERLRPWRPLLPSSHS